MRTLLRIFGVLVVLVLMAIAGAYIFIQSNWQKDYGSVLRPDISASADPAVIARGEYVVRHVAYCAECHFTASNGGRFDDAPLAGGRVFDIPLFGRFVASNLTNDSTTGIGALSDGDIARAVRNGVDHNGRVAPLMMISTGPMADEDMVAVISYLRAQASVSNRIEEASWGILGKGMATTAKPRSEPVPIFVPMDGISMERGKYLAEGPANCASCHTPRDPATFRSAGALFSGGSPWPDIDEPGYEFVAPNLTPDSATGYLVDWTEDRFVQRFTEGAKLGGSWMPWLSYRQLDEVDVRSIFRYLRSLPPVAHETGPIHRKIGEKTISGK